MTRSELEALADGAVEAARRGGAVIRAALESEAPLRIDEKSSRDFVTEVDRASEAAILAYLRSEFPDHGVLAEESAEEKAAPSGYQWVIDPLDGTTNFIHGIPVFAVSVGLRLDGRVVAGAVLDPSRDEIFRAARGGGASLNGKPIRVSGATDFDTCLVATGFPFREHGRTAAYVKTLEAVMRSTAGIRRAGSAAIDLSWVACGRFDAFWEAGLSPWDVAAGTLLIEEAGGVVTDLHGGGGFVDTGDIVAATPTLHGPLLEAVRPLAEVTPRS